MEKTKKKRKVTSRRDFLKKLSGGAIGATFVPALISQEVSSIQAKEAPVPVYSKKTITFTVNGKKVTLEVEPRHTLLSVLREKLNLRGTKRVCDHGECGGCTVLVNGNPVYSCLFLAVRAEGSSITTVEGLARNGKLHPVQEAFIEKDAFQCGFCTPGFVMSSAALLEKNPSPDTEEIREALAGNFCRCGNYLKIFEAVSLAAKRIKGA